LTNCNFNLFETVKLPKIIKYSSLFGDFSVFSRLKES